jgi:hypothetical protein
VLQVSGPALFPQGWHLCFLSDEIPCAIVIPLKNLTSSKYVVCFKCITVLKFCKSYPGLKVSRSTLFPQGWHGVFFLMKFHCAIVIRLKNLTSSKYAACFSGVLLYSNFAKAANVLLPLYDSRVSCCQRYNVCHWHSSKFLNSFYIMSLNTVCKYRLIRFWIMGCQKKKCTMLGGNWRRWTVHQLP